MGCFPPNLLAVIEELCISSGVSYELFFSYEDPDVKFTKVGEALVVVLCVNLAEKILFAFYRFLDAHRKI